MIRLNLCSRVVQPTGHVRKAHIISRIIDEKHADGIPVVGTRNTPSKDTHLPTAVLSRVGTYLNRS